MTWLPKPILWCEDLLHHFPNAGGWRGGGGQVVQALRGVTMDLHPGECLGLVGESGSGKSTLARCLLRLIEPTAGRVLYQGRDVLAMEPEELLAYRKKAQMVFQDPFGSLNPRLRAKQVLDEVLKVHGGESPPGREERVGELMSLVGLHPSHGSRYPHEFSGGQRQRLGIARALAVGPEILILDEPVSALDLSVQAQVLNLLRDLQDRLSLTLILVAHDLSVVRHLADRVAVMYLGRLVEVSTVEELFESPGHPYTRGLMAGADPTRGGKAEEDDWRALPGELPSPISPPGGCAFHPRCPHPGKDGECATIQPELGAMTGSRRMACLKESEGVD